MSSLNQEVDAIIASEGITNDNLATEEQVAQEESIVEPEQSTEDVKTEENKEEEITEDQTVEPEKTDDSITEDPIENKNEPSIGTTIEEAKTLIGNLQLTEDKIFNEDGSVKPFTEVVPVGQYLFSQITPIKVTGKDGKVYEFTTIASVEDKFPDGFEAKNNLEQMKFERSIMANETAIEASIKTYQNAEAQYTKETSDIVQSRGENERIGKEYKAMAEAGLVPKLEGNPDDPKFLESAAVKELNNILEFMDTKNKELSSKGLGQINSLYVAKQMMGLEENKVKNEDKKNAIINERKEIASLSSTPSSDTGNKKPTYSNIPLSRLADEIIASEGLK